MAAKYELLRAAESGRFRFNLKAANGQVILSSELYTTKAAAEGGVESVRANAADEGRYDRRESEAGEPYFVLTATNGRVIGTSEMYSSTSAMENGIQSVKTNADARVDDLTAG